MRKFDERMLAFFIILIIAAAAEPVVGQQGCEGESQQVLFHFELHSQMTTFLLIRFPVCVVFLSMKWCFGSAITHARAR